jgi:hypothetical protein
MPRRAPSSRVATTCACPRSRAKSPSPDRRFEPNRRFARGAKTKKPGLPRLCWLRHSPGRTKPFGIKPRLVRKRVASAGSLGQDMAGRDTRSPPCPPAYPPLPLGLPSEAEVLNDHPGSHRAANPGPLFIPSRRACQEGRRHIFAPGPLSGLLSANRRNYRDRAEIELDPGPHGRGDRHALEVSPLRAGRLCLVNGFDEGANVLRELVFAE